MSRALEAAAREWTEEQRNAAWDMHLRTRGLIVPGRAADELLCAAIARVAPRFVRVRLPAAPIANPGARVYSVSVAEALRAAGIEVEP